MKRERIHPMARVVSVANEFCNLVIKNPNSAGMKPEEAVQRLLTLYIDNFEAAPFMALMRVFKMKPPEGLTSDKKKRNSLR
jgi:HD-GYP domain-containing protein (c-di-GMP phosphodiesterase class II)